MVPPNGSAAARCGSTCRKYSSPVTWAKVSTIGWVTVIHSEAPISVPMRAASASHDMLLTGPSIALPLAVVRVPARPARHNTSALSRLPAAQTTSVRWTRIDGTGSTQGECDGPARVLDVAVGQG